MSTPLPPSLFGLLNVPGSRPFTISSLSLGLGRLWSLTQVRVRVSTPITGHTVRGGSIIPRTPI